MKKIINYGRHTIFEEDIRNVSKVLKSSFLTQGPFVQKFEHALAKKFKSKFCTVVSNGSSALYLIGKALKWKKGDTVITTPISFLATSNCIELSNANTQFIDIDEKTSTIDPNKVEFFLKKKNRVKIKALIGVDYAGHPCDWESLRYLANKYNFYLINDGCHAMGSMLNNDIGYACKYADFLTQSFHPVKTITSGEGGSILSNNKVIDNQLKLLRSHSMKKNLNKPLWFYEINEPGHNFRLSDIHSVLGLSQLRKIDKFVKLRRNIAKIYNFFFKDKINLVTPIEKKNVYHSYHLYPLQIDFNKLKINKDDFFKKMYKRRIKLQVHYIPIFMQPYYKKKYKLNPKSFNNAYNFYKKTVSLPIYPNLKKREIDLITKNIFNLI